MKAVASVVMILICLSGTICSALDVSATSAVLYEPRSETVLYTKNADKVMEIASTTKIMTAVVALERVRLDDVVTIPKQCTGIEGTSLYLKEGEKLTVSDLLYGMMLRSGNDAATAIAYHVGGNVENFVGLMNRKAYELGMVNTSFKNPSGLPAEGHTSTAKDMAKLAAYAMKNPKFAEIVSSRTKNVPGRSLSNHNKLLRIYDGANGIKTGFTKSAGRCLVSSAERDGTELIAVTLKAPDDWNDHMKLFDMGFSNYGFADVLDAGEEIASVSVVGGDCSKVSALSAGNVAIYEHKDKLGRVKRIVKLPRFLYAPICKGDIIGEVEYILDGKVIESAGIVSSDSVGILKKENFAEKFLRFFRRK